jgi:hypothetical protein
MMILISALDWVQSFQGITTISIGGISLGGITAFIVYAVKSASTMKGVGDLVKLVKEAKVMLDEEKEQTRIYKESADKKDLEIAKQSEVNNLLLKGMSIVIAASGGIDTVSKIEMVNDMKNARDILTSEVKETVKETVAVVKQEAKEQSVKVLDTAIKEAATLIDKYSKK